MSDYRVVTVDQASFDSALRALAVLGASDGVVAKVASRSINRALPTARLAASKEITALVTAKATLIKKYLRYDKANVKKLSGKIVCKGSGLNIGYFNAKVSENGIQAKIFKKSGWKNYPHAFWMPVRNKFGSIVDNIVMERHWDKFRKPFDKRKHYGKLPHEYRFKIRRVYAESVPELLERYDVMIPTLKAGGDALIKNANREMNYELGKL